MLVITIIILFCYSPKYATKNYENTLQNLKSTSVFKLDLIMLKSWSGDFYASGFFL